MKIAVVGTGYVGLVSGVCFSEMGNQVTCIDVNQAKIENLNQGIVEMYEPGLDLLFNRNQDQGRISFENELSKGILDAEIVFLALPTPQGTDGEADLSAVRSVVTELSKLLTRYTIIVNKSTVPVGTTKMVTDILSKTLDQSLFDVVSNPEFLREGAAVQDFLKPERVVIGSSSEKAIEKMKQLYHPFVRQGNPILIMDEISAELTKYAANAFLATKITFMNEIANLSEEVGANVDQVRRALGSDSRIGKRFLFPGVGYGGSCFPKDVYALRSTANQVSYDFKILNAIIDVNAKQRMKVYDKLLQYFNGDLQNKRIAIWGLAFKPNTDDIREAPSLYTIDALLSSGADVCVYDPEAMKNVKEIYGDKLHYETNLYDALIGADAMGIMTEWSVFRTPDYELMMKNMESPVIVDGRNVLNPEYMSSMGFSYFSIGRPSH